jgi:hypothetical protein
LVLVSFYVSRWIQIYALPKTASASFIDTGTGTGTSCSGSPTTKTAKKKAKKAAKKFLKKKKTSDTLSPTEKSPQSSENSSEVIKEDIEEMPKNQKKITFSSPVSKLKISKEEESDSDSSSDDGLSAAQILAKRKFNINVAIGPKSMSASSKASNQKDIIKYEVGDVILARFEGKAAWFPGKITEVKRGNEYTIKYDDGEIEHRVSHTLIKRKNPTSTLTSPTSTTSSGLKAIIELNKPYLVAEEPPSPSVVTEDQKDGNGFDLEEEEHEDDDGWQFVSSTSSNKKKKNSSQNSQSVSSETNGGLTKRQRENKRKKERQKEIKEAARSQAQEQGLHAKWGGQLNKMTYVPPPSKSS